MAGDGIALEVAEAVLSGDDDVVGHAEEEAVFDDAGAGTELGGEFLGICEGAEGAVVNEVAFVGDERAAVRPSAQDGVAVELLEEEPLGFRAERNNFNRQGVLGAELRGHFGFVDHDDFAPAGLGDDFFVEEGAAAALDEVELGIHFVGAVDGDVDDGGALGIDERQAGLLGGAGNLAGGGEGAESGEFTGGVAAGDFADGVDGGGAGAEADNGAGFDKADGVDGGGLFEGVPVERAHEAHCAISGGGREKFRRRARSLDPWGTGAEYPRWRRGAVNPWKRPCATRFASS